MGRRGGCVGSVASKFCHFAVSNNCVCLQKHIYGLASLVKDLAALLGTGAQSYDASVPRVNRGDMTRLSVRKRGYNCVSWPGRGETTRCASSL